MKSYQPACIHKVCQQRGDVAIADKNLWAAPDRVQIERLQQIVRAIAAARTQNRLHIRTRKHFGQLANAPLERPGKVKIALKNGIEIKRLVAHDSQSLTASVEFAPLEIAGRSNNADRVPGPESGRLDARRV